MNLKRTLKKFTLLTLSFGVIFSLASCKEEKENSALFVYLSGANLESDYGQASKFIDELTKSKANENVTIYMLAGGSENWQKTEFNPSFTTFLEIKDGKMKVLESKSMNMGDKNTLKYLIDFSKTIDTPKKNLLFWGHGNKFEICHDHNFNYDALTYKELDEGLGDSKFETIYFNSCFSSNLDLLSYISDNANYALVSEQTFPSKSYDINKFLETLSNPNLNTLEKNKKIIDDTKLKYLNTSFNPNLTLSCIDLKELNSHLEDIQIFFNGSKENYKETYKAFRSASNIGSSSKDLIEVLSSLKSPLEETIRKVISYEIHSDRVGSNGIGIYFDDNLKSYDLAKYSLLAYYPIYYSLLKYKNDNLNGSFLTVEPYLVTHGNLLAKKIINSDFLGFVSYALYNENMTQVKEDILGLELDMFDEEFLALLSKEALFGYKFNGLELFNSEIYSFDFVDTSLKVSYIAPIKVNETNIFLKYSVLENEDSKVLNVEGLLSFDEETSEERLIPLNNGDIIEINETKFTYLNNSLSTYKLDEASVVFIVEDIFGQQYFTNPELVS